MGEVRPTRRIAPTAVIWLLIAFGYFFIPLIATFLFSLKSNQTGHCCTAANYSWVVHSSAFWHTLKISFLLALETIAISLALFVPTISWVHLRVPRLRPVIAFLALMGIWAIANSVYYFGGANGRHGFDPYPYILLNLMLSMVAGLQGAILLIAAKRADQVSSEVALHTLDNTTALSELLTRNTQLTEQMATLTDAIHAHVCLGRIGDSDS